MHAPGRLGPEMHAPEMHAPGPGPDVPGAGMRGRMTDALVPRGRFIVVEGPDGSGKSVQAARLADHLEGAGLRVTLTREPGGTRLGEQVRAVLLDVGPTPRGAWSDALLFSAARAQLVEEVIRPALARGETVVCDRYATSTLAYQGHGSGLDLERLAMLEDWVTGGLQPDLVVLLDVPVEVGLARRGAGAPAEMTRFEDGGRHDRAFHERVRAGYLSLARADPRRWRVVDARPPAEVVSREVAAVVDAALRRDDPTAVGSGSSP
jgi:dTMP kinase